MPNPTRFCMCGCGELAPIATKTNTKSDKVKGQPCRYIMGHQARIGLDPPNPSGICMCGCGQRTNIANTTKAASGSVQGHPQQYLIGHHRKPSKPVEERFWEKVSVGGHDECHEWKAGRNKSGYGKFQVDGRTLGAHRMAWILTYGDIPDGLYVCHTCDNPPCCNARHLFLGTNADNLQDMRDKGRQRTPSGEEAANAKLTEDDVIAIRADPRLQRVIAAEYGVSRENVSRIKLRQTWARIP